MIRVQSAAILAVAALTLSGTAAQAQTAFALNGGNLISFDIANPSVLLSNNPLTTALDAIDFRVQTGVLFGYSSATDTVYTVTAAGAVTPTAFGSATGTAQETTTANLGIDFNPTTGTGAAAAFRIVTANDENRVYNSVTNAYVAGQNNLRFLGTANGVADGASVVENAYTNNLSGAGSTVQYVVESSTNSLYTLNNAVGEITLVGALGVTVNPATVGFDIYTPSFGVNNAYGVFGNNGVSSIYSVNLGTGAASAPLAIGNGTLTSVRSLAIVPVVVPEAGTAQLVLGALMVGMGVVVRRRVAK